MGFGQLLTSGSFPSLNDLLLDSNGRVQLGSDGGNYCPCCQNPGGGPPPPPPPPPTGGCSGTYTPLLSCTNMTFTSGSANSASVTVSGALPNYEVIFSAGGFAPSCQPKSAWALTSTTDSSGSATFKFDTGTGCYFCNGSGSIQVQTGCTNTISCPYTMVCQLQASPNPIAFTLGSAANVTVSYSGGGYSDMPVIATPSGLTGVSIKDYYAAPGGGSGSFVVSYDGSGSTAENGTITVSQPNCCTSTTINVTISNCTTCNCPSGAVNIGLSGSITFPAQNGGNPIPLASGQNLTNGTSGGCSWGPTGTFTAPTSGAYAVVTTASISGYTPSGSSCGYFYTCSLGGWYVLTTGGTHYTWNWASGNYSGEKPIPACSLTGFGWLLNQCHDAGSSTAHDTPQGTASYSSTGQSGSITFG